MEKFFHRNTEFSTQKRKGKVFTMKVKKSLFLNGEVLRVEKTDDKVRYLKVTDDNEAMQEVSYFEFMEFFKKLAYVFITSWNTELIEQYREFDKFINDL